MPAVLGFASVCTFEFRSSIDGGEVATMAFLGRPLVLSGPSGHGAIINHISSPAQETGISKLDSNELCRNCGFLQSLAVLIGCKEVSHSLGK